jgi:hypothetical protein
MANGGRQRGTNGRSGRPRDDAPEDEEPRLRLSETYTAPQSYHLVGDELVLDRRLGRPRNSVVLPRGWYLTWLSIPAVVRQTPEGLVRIDFVNGRPDAVDVLLKAKRLAAP